MNGIKRIASTWNNISLPLRICTGLVIGVILGIAVPQATGISILGDMFVGALKAMAPLLVFVLIMSSLAQAGSGIGKKFSTVIGLYLLGTFLAALVASAASFIFPATIKLTDAAQDAAPGGIAEVLKTLLTKIVENPVSALMNANYIGILAWAIILGIALKKLASSNTKVFFADLSEVLTKVVRWIINCAPLGIMGLVFKSVSEQGLGIFKDYGRLLVLLVGCMLFVAFIMNPLITALCLHRNPYPLVLKCLRESGITAFFTRSSAANIPVNLGICESLELDKEMYSVSIPLGATINMSGAAITITTMTLATVHTMGISVDFGSALILSLLAAVAACGTSGVAGGSILLIPMACSLFGITNDVAMQVVGVGFVIGVIQDSLETAINSSSDVLFTSIAEFMQWKKEGKKFDLKKLVKKKTNVG